MLEQILFVWALVSVPATAFLVLALRAGARMEQTRVLVPVSSSAASRRAMHHRAS